MDGHRLKVEAAMSLPMDVLLETDAQELAEMLWRKSVQESALVAVKTSCARQQRDQGAKQLLKEESGVYPTPLEVECQDKPRGLEEAQEEEEPEEGPHPQESCDQKEHESRDDDNQEVMENDPYTDVLKSQKETNPEDRDAFRSEFDDDLFPLTIGSGRAHLSRSLKCAAKHLHHLQQGRLQ